MNRLSGLLVLAGVGVSLGFLGSGLWGQAPDKGEVVNLGGLKSRTPPDWVAEKPDEQQGSKQFRLEPVAQDKEPARLTITFLGKGKGGTAAEYVRRWKALFLPPEGKELEEVARVQQWKVSGAAVTYLDIHGDYRGLPGNPMTPRQNFRLLGVYFATSQGPYLIRVFGPADTVAFYRKGFEDWLKAFR